jgi:hypothetical protein
VRFIEGKKKMNEGEKVTSPIKEVQPTEHPSSAVKTELFPKEVDREVLAGQGGKQGELHVNSTIQHMQDHLAVKDKEEGEKDKALRKFKRIKKMIRSRWGRGEQRRYRRKGKGRRRRWTLTG